VESLTVNTRKLHSTGLVPDSLAALVLDFMSQHRLGLRGLAAAADVVAADCRFNYWVAMDVKKSGLSERGWIKLLDDGEQNQEHAIQAMKAYATNQDLDQLSAAFTDVTAKLNNRSLLDQ
jgi:hypothetical protein